MVFVYSLPPFWQQKQKSRELEAMGRNQNADFFAAASPADMQWSDFYRHIPDRDLGQRSHRRGAASSELSIVAGEPPWCSHVSDSRWSLFFRHLLEVFDIDDHWFRYEWQGRGSGHIHGFYWTKDSPKANEQGQYLPTGESS